MHTMRSSRLGKLARAIALHNYAVTPLSIPPALRSAVLRTARCVFASVRMSGKLILSAAQPRNRVGIRWRRTTPVKAATPRAATRRLRSEMLAIFLLSYPSPPIPNISDIYARTIHFCQARVLFYFHTCI